MSDILSQLRQLGVSIGMPENLKKNLQIQMVLLRWRKLFQTVKLFPMILATSSATELYIPCPKAMEKSA